MTWTASEIVVAILIATFFVAGFFLGDIVKWL